MFAALLQLGVGKIAPAYEPQLGQNPAYEAIRTKRQRRSLDFLHQIFGIPENRGMPNLSVRRRNCRLVNSACQEMVYCETCFNLLQKDHNQPAIGVVAVAGRVLGVLHGVLRKVIRDCFCLVSLL
jgi:hypothetical protein